MSELMTEELAVEHAVDTSDGFGESSPSERFEYLDVLEDALEEPDDQDETGEEPEDADGACPAGGPGSESREDAAGDAGDAQQPARTDGPGGETGDEAWPYGESEVDPDRPPSRDITTKELGRRGENAAVNYLVRKGFQILERNWTCRFGEADIIALDEDGVVCFVEVKTRRTVDTGLPEEAITKEKQRRYEKLALAYMMEADWDDDVDLRFDAIGIYVTGDFKAILKYHRGCFDGLD